MEWEEEMQHGVEREVETATWSGEGGGDGNMDWKEWTRWQHGVEEKEQKKKRGWHTVLNVKCALNIFFPLSQTTSVHKSLVWNMKHLNNKG